LNGDKSSATLDRPLLNELLTLPNGNGKDKMRLLFICKMLLGDSLNSTIDNLEALENSLKDSGADTNSLLYLKQIQQMAKLNGRFMSNNGPPTSTVGVVLDNAKVKHTLNQLKDTVWGGLTNLNLVAVNKDLKITRITESLMENKDKSNYPEADNFLYFDPRSSTSSAVRIKTQFSDAIVFAVGGGGYVEYENLQSFAKSNSKNILFGATEMFTPNEFLDQLSQLGKQHVKQ